MAKKTRRPAPRKRTASSSRRKAAPKRSSRRPSRRTTGGEPLTGYRVELKPILASIEKAVAGLRAMPPTEAIKITVERLERCAFEFNAICGNGDCGPDMAFPPRG